MKILIVAATDFEIKVLTEYLKNYKKHEIHTLITGIGTPNTIYQTTKKINSEKFDLAINIGITGAFIDKAEIENVYEIESDFFSDIGIEDNTEFIHVNNTQFFNPNEFPFHQGKLHSTFSTNLPKLKGLTSNTVHGNSQSINKLTQQFMCDCESMEGAAFYFVCLSEKIPCVQIRAISNYIEPRDKSKWRINEAILNLNNSIINIINSF